MRGAALTVARATLTVAGAALAAACVGGHYRGAPAAAAPAAGSPLAVVLDRIAAERKAHGRQPAVLVPELEPIVDQQAVRVAHREVNLATGAHAAALRAVSETGRHVWTFGTECPDLGRFTPPPMLADLEPLLLGASVAYLPSGAAIVMLAVAEPGSSALRADQFGGGNGGTLPGADTFAHPATADLPCGARWPAPARTPL